MAMQEVTLTPEEQAAAQGTFFNFEKIGQFLHGRYVREEAQSGQFAKAHWRDYVFKITDPTTKAVIESKIGSAGIQSLMKKAIEKGGPDGRKLTPGMIVKVTYVSDLDTGKGSPMKQFRMGFDPDSAAKKAAAPPPPKKAEPAPEPAADVPGEDDAPQAGADDIPF